MLNKTQIGKIDGWLFFLGYIPILFVGILNTSAFSYKFPTENINQLLMAFALLLFIFKSLINEYSRKEFIFYLILFCILCLSWKNSHSSSLMSMFIFMISTRNVDSKRVNQVYLIVSTFLMGIVILAALRNIIPNYTYFRDGLSRSSFGIIYPTDFASHIFYILCSLAYLRRNKFGLKDMLFISTISYFVYLGTNARLNFICSLLLAVGMYLVKFDTKNLIKKITWLAPTIGTVVMASLTYLYDPSSRFMNLLNHILSGRLSIVNEVIHEYGIHLFGTNIIQNGLGGPSGLNFNAAITKYVFIDSSYMRLLLMYGVVSLILVTVWISGILKKVDDKYLLMILLVIFVSGAIENHMLELAYNPFFLILFSTYIQEKRLVQTNKGSEL